MSQILGAILRAVLIVAVILPWKTEPASAAFTCDTIIEISISTCQGLVDLYNSTGGPNWKRKDNWFLTNDPRDWYGITLDQGYVMLNLAGNNLTGALPATINKLDIHYLNLNSNHLSGTIPAKIGDMWYVNTIKMKNNHFTGPLPAEIGNILNLFELDISQNNLSGPLPAEIGNLVRLEVFNASDNKFSGSIPATIGSMSALQDLDLSRNELTGSIPSELGSLSSIQYIFLSDNALEGPIPETVGNLSNLMILNILRNRISGPIPTSIATMPQLYGLVLDGNRITGEIPAGIWNIPTLSALSVAGNQLTGSIPTTIGAINLSHLNLYGNKFTGSIPANLGNLTGLRVLGLGDNLFSGPIPLELAQLTNLVGLGQGPFGEDGLSLDYNKLDVPSPYPSEPPSALEAFLMAKDPDWHLHQAQTIVVDPSGGTFEAADLSAEITIPVDAVTDQTTLEYQPQPQPSEATGSLAFANNSFLLRALDAQGDPLPTFTFAEPVTLTMTYVDSDITRIKEESLAVYYWDETESAWKDAATTCPAPNETIRDVENNIVTVNICHLSEFSLLGQKIEYKIYIPVTRK